MISNPLPRTSRCADYHSFAQSEPAAPSVLRLFQVVHAAHSKFSGYVQIETRNSNGELISVTESDTLNYLPYYLTDEYLDENELTRIVSINGIKYEERKFKETWHASWRRGSRQSLTD